MHLDAAGRTLLAWPWLPDYPWFHSQCRYAAMRKIGINAVRGAISKVRRNDKRVKALSEIPAPKSEKGGEENTESGRTEF